MNCSFQIITTPKKIGYQLRSRSIIVPGSGLPPSPCGSSPSLIAPDFGFSELKGKEEDMITDESTPHEVMEENIRMLAEELSKSKVSAGA